MPIKLNNKRLIPTALALILLLMAFLRVGYFLQVRDYPGFNRFIFPDDQIYYHKTAMAIAEGFIIGEDGPITRGPGYSYFLGVVYQLSGKNTTAARVVQWALGILTGLLIYLLTKRIFSPREAITACLLYALYLPAICYEGALLMASLVTFLVTAGFYCLLRAIYEKSPPWLILSGTFYGWAFICRPNNLLFFLTGLIILVAHKTDKRQLLRFVLPFMLVYGLIVTRNLIAGTDLLSITTQGFHVLMNSHFHQASGVGWWSKNIFYTMLEKYDNHFWAFLLFLTDDITSHKTAWILLQLSKLYAFFFNYEFSQFVDYYAYREVVPLLRLPYVSMGILSPLTILGLALLFRKRREKGHLLLAFYFITGVFSVVFFYVLSRFRLPMVPLFCVISAYTLWRLPGTFYGLSRTGRISMTAVLIALAIGVNAKPVWTSYQKKFMPVAIFNRGVLYKADGRYHAAASDFKRIYTAMDENTDADAYYRVAMNLADCLHQVGNNDQAAAIWHELTRKTPDKAPPFYRLSRYFARKDQYDRSLLFLQTAVKLKPHSAYLTQLLQEIRQKAAAGGKNEKPDADQGRENGIYEDEI